MNKVGKISHSNWSTYVRKSGFETKSHFLTCEYYKNQVNLFENKTLVTPNVSSNNFFLQGQFREFKFNKSLKSINDKIRYNNLN